MMFVDKRMLSFLTGVCLLCAASIALADAAIQKLDPNNQANGRMIEKAYIEMQAANETVSAVQLKAIENQAAAKEQKK